MTLKEGPAEEEQQIPFGDDNQKSKCKYSKSNSRTPEEPLLKPLFGQGVASATP